MEFRASVVAVLQDYPRLYSALYTILPDVSKRPRAAQRGSLSSFALGLARELVHQAATSNNPELLIVVHERLACSASLRGVYFVSECAPNGFEMSGVERSEAESHVRSIEGLDRNNAIPYSPLSRSGQLGFGLSGGGRCYRVLEQASRCRYLRHSASVSDRVTRVRASDLSNSILIA